MTFSEKYLKIKQYGQKELKTIENRMVSLINIKEPLNSYLKEFLTLPSKRIRPLLAILYTKACGENLSQEQLDLLSIIEIVHNASLIHDDVIDESKTRRAHKTISAEFDNKLAVISGDYLLSVAMEKLAQLDNMEIIKRFSKTIRQMCIGEINQNTDRFKIGTIEDYIEKNKNKTAYLFETTLVCCAILGRNSDIESISKFALDTGIAFQIRDDLINITGSDPKKPSQNDIQDGIYNAPVIYAQDTQNYASGIEKTKVLLNNYVKSAQKHLQKLQKNEYQTALIELLELLNNV